MEIEREKGDLCNRGEKPQMEVERGKKEITRAFHRQSKSPTHATMCKYTITRGKGDTWPSLIRAFNSQAYV